VLREVLVKGLSMQRGPAPVAQALYEESAESLEKRLLAAEQRRLHSEPAQSIEHGRPTKRDRRSMDKGWDSRWSASIDGADA
jgi:ribosome-associated heat shock protein Hsp15